MFNSGEQADCTVVPALHSEHALHTASEVAVQGNESHVLATQAAAQATHAPEATPLVE